MGNVQSKSSTLTEICEDDEPSLGKSPDISADKNTQSDQTDLKTNPDFGSQTSEIKDTTSVSKNLIVNESYDDIYIFEVLNAMKCYNKSVTISIVKTDVKNRSRYIIKKRRAVARKVSKYPQYFTFLVENKANTLLLAEHQKVISELVGKMNKNATIGKRSKVQCDFKEVYQFTGGKEQKRSSGSVSKEVGQSTGGERDKSSGSVSKEVGQSTVGERETSSGSVSKEVGESVGGEDQEETDRFYSRERKSADGTDIVVPPLRFASDVTLRPGAEVRTSFVVRPLSPHVRSFEVRVTAAEGVYVAVHPARKDVVSQGHLVFATFLALQEGSARPRRFQQRVRSWAAAGGLEVVQLTLTCSDDSAEAPPPPSYTDLLDDIAQMKTSLLTLGGIHPDSLDLVLDRADRLYHRGQHQEAWEAYLMVHTLQDISRQDTSDTIVDMLKPVVQLIRKKKEGPWETFFGIFEDRLSNPELEMENKLELVKSMGKLLLNCEFYNMGIKLFTKLNSVLEENCNVDKALTMRVYIIELYFRLFIDDYTEKEKSELYFTVLSFAKEIPQNEYKSICRLLDIAVSVLIFNTKNAMKLLQSTEKILQVKESHIIYKHSILHKAYYQGNEGNLKGALKLVESAQKLAKKYGTEKDVVSQYAMLMTGILQTSLRRYNLSLLAYDRLYHDVVEAWGAGDSLAKQAKIGKCRTLCKMGRFDEAWALYLDICNKENEPMKKPKNCELLLELVSKLCNSFSNSCFADVFEYL